MPDMEQWYRTLYKCPVCGYTTWVEWQAKQGSPAKRLEKSHAYSLAFTRRLKNPKLANFYCWQARLEQVATERAEGRNHA